MKLKRIWIAAVCAVLLLSGCTPRLIGEEEAKQASLRLIGEEEAKQAALRLINTAFDARATDTEVKYAEHVGESYKKGTVVQYGTEEPKRLYIVTSGVEEDGNYRYYAEVNAVTGVAYRADRNPTTIVLTEEQKKQAAALGTFDDFSSADFSEEQQNSLQLAEQWVRDRLEPDVPFLRTVSNNVQTDNIDFPLVRMDDYVILENGTIYNVTFCWPSMDVIEVSVLNQEK